MATKKNTTVAAAPVDEKILTPSEYFDILNGKSKTATEESLRTLYNNAMTLMRKYKITGQRAGALKLYNFALLCEREIEVVHAGINVYVERRDIEYYIEHVSKKTVVIIDLESYERDIPDDVVERIADLKEKNIFDAYYVVFTDYTGGERRKVEKERREKDPILFGALTIGESKQLSTRMYHIASWEDEHCDLTLDKMVGEIDAARNNGETVQRTVTEEFGSLEEFKKAFVSYGD